MTLYDSRGESHQLDVYFVKTAENQWAWHALGDGGELAGGNPGETVEMLSGTLQMSEDGKLQSEADGSATLQFTGAAAQTVAFDFGEAIADGGDGGGTTGYGTPSVTHFLGQDGFGAGTFQYLNVRDDGSLEGTFSNGKSALLGQVALADFGAPQNLLPVGGNLFLGTIDSGVPEVGKPGTGSLGQVFSGMLEQSNVDVTSELTQMIVSQRGYQAASRTIVTADQMLQEAVNLKR